MATRQSNVIITANGKQAEAVLKAIDDRVKLLTTDEKRLREELAKMRKENKANTDEYRQLQNTLKGVQREMKSLNDAANKNVSNMEKVDKVIKDLAHSTTRQLRDALRAGKKELERMSAADKDLIPLQNRLRQIQEQIAKNTGEMERFGKVHNSAWSTAWNNIRNYVIMMASVNAAIGKMRDLVKANLEFSDSLADVRKVSGLEIEDINQLAVNLSKIDTRTSLSTLVGNLAYSGAKLGFGNMGIEGLESYVKAANQVNVALGEELGENAMPALSKITENMGLIKKMGVEKAMLATGSAIFKLASTSTASAGPIVEFSKRLLSIGKNAGLTTDQILALGSAADSMMLMPEVASTALGKLVIAMQTNHNLIEKSLQIDPGTISNLYQSGDIMKAMLLIFEKMKEKGGINALGGIFKDLGSDGQRLKATLVTMSEQLPMLKQHLETSKQAFEEATAVTAEYNIQQQTAAGIMQRANNMWEKAFINPEGVDMVKEMAKAWYDVSKSLTQSEGYVKSMQFSLQALFTILSGLIRLAPAAIFALAARGLMALATILGVTKIATDGLAASWARMSAAMKANVISLVIGLVAQLAITIYSFASKTKEADTAMQGFDMSLTELETQAGIAASEMHRLGNAILEAKKGTEARQAAINVFNQKFGQYLSNMITEESTAKDLAKAYDEVTAALRAKLALQLKQKDIETQVQTREGWAVQRREEYAKEVQGTNFSQYGREWITGFAKDNKNRDVRDVAKDIGRIFGVTEKEMANMMPFLGQDDSRNRGLYRDNQWYARLAMRYILQDRSAQWAMRKVNQKWAPEQKAMDELSAKEAPQPTYQPLANEAPDKAAIRAARQAELEEKKEMRQQLQESEAEAKAIVDNIKNFYERQITETINIATQAGMDPELQDQLVRDLTMRMNSALAQARKAVAGTKNEWEQFKKTIQDDMVEPLVDGTNESMQLLDKIENNNLAALRKQIAALSKSLNKPESALIDQVWKNATLNEKANAKIENKQEQRRRQAILDKNYTQKVNEDTQSTMEQFGFAGLTEKQMETIRKGGAEAKNFLEQRTREWQTLLENARKNFSAVAMSGDSPDSLFAILFGQDWESHRDEMTLRGLLDLTGEDFKLFYEELIKYNDAYVEAQKRAYDRSLKIQNQLFNNRFDILMIDEKTSDLQAFLKKEQREGGMMMNVAQRMGFADITNDPEILRLELLQERAWKYYDDMKVLREQDRISEEQLQNAKKQMQEAEEARLDYIASQMQERAKLLEQTLKPVEDFGKALGEALSNGDADERAEAVKQALKSLAQSLSEQTSAMVKEWMLQLVKKKMFAKLMAQEEKKSQQTQTDIAEQEGENRLDVTGTVETGIATITQQAGQLITSAHKSQAAENAATTAAETEGNVAAGVAGGAAKTISELGWWGIPLVAVITALLNGLLAFALGKLFGVGKKADEAKVDSHTINRKLVSGMLTYDSGNVRSVLGTDGRIYMARDEGTIQTGIVRHPITANVNGQPSLIAERGPELVVGRETTQAIMLSRPDIIKTITQIDRLRSGRGYRALDSGDITALSATSAAADVTTKQMLETLKLLAPAIVTLTQQLQHPIRAEINKYGYGGLIDEVQSGLKFVNKYK